MFDHTAHPAAFPSPDPYAARGVVLSRDTAHLIIGALRRDAYDLRTRPCDANFKAADTQEAVAEAIGRTLVTS